MSAYINLGLVFHQHQPVGNYGFVFDELFQKSYDPLVSCLERHPGVKVGLHYSGPLLDWLREHKPEYIQRIRALVERGQVEMLGGGYYEPALPAISEADRIGQLSKMRVEVERLFGTPPTGAWVAERVWEPSFPTALSAAGYKWTILDDVHFEGAGVGPEELDNWYLTEAEGDTIGVFGSSTRFRYLVPWGTVEDCINFLRSRGDHNPGSLVSMGDDGEKFGGWPTTYTHCWENGWVDSFFARLEAESHWISTVHLGRWQREHDPKSLVYLPTTSYMEMGEWSLPPREQHEMERAKAILHDHGGDGLERFFHGGHWRNFLTRYPEVNLLQKRSLHLSRDAHKQHNDAALDHIWQAQCNCPFWHGVFGGVYLENIRHANFGHLSMADAELFPGHQPPDVRDWNFDGKDEVCLRSANELVTVAPGTGGEIEHWDLRERGWNLTHVMARRPEAYHQGLGMGHDDSVRNIHDQVRVKDPEVLRRGFQYDRGMRLAAQDTFLHRGASHEEYGEERQRRVADVRHWSLGENSVAMDCAIGDAEYRKVISVADEVEAAYEIRGHDGRLFSEWNLSLPSSESGDPSFEQADGLLTIRAGGFRLEASHNADDVWYEQIFSASNTEGGVELAPQGWAVVFAKDVSASEPGCMTLRWRTQA
jgi:alpha-amylase